MKENARRVPERSLEEVLGGAAVLPPSLDGESPDLFVHTPDGRTFRRPRPDG